MEQGLLFYTVYVYDFTKIKILSMFLPYMVPTKISKSLVANCWRKSFQAACKAPIIFRKQMKNKLYPVTNPCLWTFKHYIRHMPTVLR